MDDPLTPLAARTQGLARRGADLWREGSHRLREQARHAADSTLVHIRHEPLKAVLIAGAIGAVLGWLLSSGSRGRD